VTLPKVPAGHSQRETTFAARIPASKEIATMSVFVSIWLFGKPGHELNEGEPVTAGQLRDLAGELHDRLNETAAVVEKLIGAGWEAHMALYDIHFSHPFLNTKTAVEDQFLSLGIDLDKLCIDEWEDEEEFIEEGDEEGWEDEGDETELA
jgi:hypothetical protein